MLPSKPSLAIVGTFDDLCGIAAYVKTMVRLLGDHFDVKVFDLDQFLLRHPSSKVQRLAEAEIDRICDELRGFDAVNIQLEHGLFGIKPKVVLRRLTKLISSSRTLVITFHTIIPSEPAKLRSVIRSAARGRPLRGIQEFRKICENNILSDGLYRFIRREQQRRNERCPVSIVVHTRRDSRMMQVVYGLRNVYDHPLAQLDSARVAEIRSRADRSRFSGLAKVPSDAILLGCFGFLSPYKGFDTAVRAMTLLPDRYHLAIFGATHPGSTKPFAKRDPYVSKLLHLLHAGQRVLAEKKSRGINLSVDGKDLQEVITAADPADISKRVHFLGALSDEDFPAAISVCDTVLLPYREVGQSSSGPLCLGVELGKHVIATRTKAFLQAQRYYRNRYRTIDIDNHVELAQAIEAESGVITEYPLPSTYNADTNRALYVALLRGEQPQDIGFPAPAPVPSDSLHGMRRSVAARGAV